MTQRYVNGIVLNLLTGICLLVFSQGLLAQGETITVDTTSDVEDFGGAQQVANLPGPDGVVSLREAVTASNNTAGAQTIEFAIPTTDPGFNGSTFVIQIESTPPLIIGDDATTLDGTTQTSFTGDTNPNGSEIFLMTTPPLANINGLTFNSNDNAVSGIGGFLQFRYGIELNGDNNVVTNCDELGGLSAGVHINGSNNRIGGTSPGDANTISSSGNGVWMRDGATNNVVLGNLITGNHNSGVDMEVGANGNTVGGTTAAARNIIMRNGHTSGSRTPVGAQVTVDGDNNVVQGNYLGVDATGTSDQSGSARAGLDLSGSFNTIGGTDPGAGNIISGHGVPSNGRRAGIWIDGGSNNTIQGNLIGTDVTGTNPIANQTAILIDVFISGNIPNTITISNNTIAFSVEEGISISGFGSSNPTAISISENSIFSNGTLGIDLLGDGVTNNDPGDGDTGPNGLQNFPVITSVTDNGSSTEVNGTLDTPNPNTATVELFSNGSPDPSGFGEGETFQTAVTPDAAGNFTATLPGGLSGQHITATAIDANGNTSEFSAAVPVGGGIVTLTLTPVNPPILIPPSGGSFQFDVEIVNNTSSTQNLDFWTLVRLPNGTTTDPLFGPAAVQLASGESISATLTQNVPPVDPATFTYIGRVGAFPSTVTASDSFTFTVSNSPTVASTSMSETVDDWTVTVAGDAFVTVSETESVPEEFTLQQNYPNPFNPTTQIAFSLPTESHVSLKVYNQLGQEVMTLLNSERSAGQHTVQFDATDLPSGVYFYRLQAEDFNQVRRMTLVR